MPAQNTTVYHSYSLTGTNAQESALVYLQEVLADPNKVVAEANNALCLAAQFGFLDIMKRLLDIPAVKDTAAANSYEMLLLAVENGHLTILNSLLDIPAVRDDAATNNNHALSIAAQKGDVAIVERLLDIPAVKDTAAAFNNSALGWAATNNHLDVVNILLKIPTVLNAFITGANFALRIAGEKGHLDIVYRLLDIQACSDWVRTNEDPNIINEPWFITIRNAHEQKVRKTALEVAHSAHSDLKVNCKLAYPKDNNTDYATQFAMGIVAQLKSTPETPDLIMKQILGYLPYMDDKRSTECIKLAAMRPKPTLPVAEPIEPVPNQFKRQSEGSEPAAKRQKQRVGQREMAFLQGNEAVLAPRSERARPKSHPKRFRIK